MVSLDSSPMSARTVTYGANTFTVVRRMEKRKWRKAYHCCFIASSGLHQGQQCTFERRHDSPTFTNYQGVHQHSFDMRALFQSPGDQQIAQDQIVDAFVQVIADANISIRKSVSPNLNRLINDSIKYGFSLARSRPGDLNQADLWHVTNRQHVKELLMRKSESLKTSTIQKFREGIVHVSIDASTLNHTSIVDVVLISSRPGHPVEVLLYNELLLPDSSADSYKTYVADTLIELHESGLRVVSIITDGFSSQRCAFDESRSTSIQNDVVLTSAHPFLRSVLWIYCRCHLVNLVIQDWWRDSPAARSCHEMVTTVCKVLRKKEARVALHAVCPEWVDSRFCYDYRLIRFIAMHRQAIRQLEIVQIDSGIFAYGMMIEVIWHLMGRLEDRNATLADAFDHELSALEDLRKIEDRFRGIEEAISENCRLLRGLISARLSEQRNLSMVCFSLTIRGRQYFRALSGFSDDISERPRHISTLADIYSFEIAGIAVDESQVVQGPENCEEEGEFEDDDDEQDSEDSEDESELDDPDESGMRFAPGELDHQIGGLEAQQALNESEEKRRGIIDIATQCIREWGERSEMDCSDIDSCLHQYVVWMTKDSPLEFMSADDIHLWDAMRFSGQWKQLAQIASVLTRLPCTEVENERMFGIKRRIIGKCAVRTSPRLLTARARLASAPKR